MSSEYDFQEMWNKGTRSLKPDREEIHTRIAYFIIGVFIFGLILFIISYNWAGYSEKETYTVLEDDPYDYLTH